MQVYLSNNMPKYMVDFTYFAMMYLGMDKLRGEIEVKLSKRNLAEESFGLCWGDRRECEVQIASKQWGEPVSRENKLKTIAHELTHAHQYFTGRLKAKDDVLWKGNQIEYDVKDEESMPWEVEAREYEEEIYKAWKKKNEL